MFFHILILAFYVFKCAYVCLSADVLRAIDISLINDNLTACLLTYIEKSWNRVTGYKVTGSTI